MSKKRLLFRNGLNKVIMAVVNRLNILRVVFTLAVGEGRKVGGGGEFYRWYNFFFSFRSVSKLLYILSSLVPALHFS